MARVYGGDVPKHPQGSAFDPRGERARVSGGDGETSGSGGVSASPSVSLGARFPVERRGARILRVGFLVASGVHDRTPDVHAPRAVHHRGHVLGGDEARQTLGFGELGESKHVHPRLVRVERGGFRSRAAGVWFREPRSARARRLEGCGFHEREVEDATRRAERAQVARVQTTQNRHRDVRGEVHERHRTRRR
jgi:hypothetical protein